MEGTCSWDTLEWYKIEQVLGSGSSQIWVASRVVLLNTDEAGTLLVTNFRILFLIACAWKPVIKRMGMWKSIRLLARLYDAGMGMLIFLPVALCSWFPFVSTFQTCMMFNQAFSRGLEISLILAGNNPSSGL